MREPYTLTEAQRLLAVSDSTIRRMVRAGVLKEIARDEHNRILLEPESVDAAAVSLGRVDIQGLDIRREIAPAVNALSEMVSTLNQTIHQQNERLIELAGQLGEARAEARLFPAIAESKEQHIKTLESELQGARAALEQARQEIESLREAALSKSGDQVTSQPEVTSLRAKIRRLLGGE